MPKPIELPEWMRLIKGDMTSKDNEPVDILLAGPIGYNPDTYEGISSRVFGQVLAGIPKQKPVTLLINTWGGKVDEGVAMHNMCLARGNVNTCVVGYAASIGAIIAQAGVKRCMMPGTMMIIHNPNTVAAGESKDMEHAADFLQQVKDSLIGLMHARSGVSKKKLSDWMDATTAFDPEDAVEAGLADEVVDSNPSWNFIPRSEDSGKQILQQLKNSAAAVKQTDSGNKQQKPMKSLIAALAAKGLIPSADLTDEAAVVAAFNNGFSVYTGLKTENESLNNRVKQFADAQELRVNAAITNAIETEKLVKAERKPALVAMGKRSEQELMDYLADLRALKGDDKGGEETPANEVQPQKRQGTPPVKRGAGEGEETNEKKMERLRNELKSADASRAYEISCELRDLRGHGKIFATV